MKISLNDFRFDTAQATEVPLDFVSLCAFLAEHQAATPTARRARDGEAGAAVPDPAHPAVAVLLGAPGEAAAAPSAHGSFHAAAAALVNRSGTP